MLDKNWGILTVELILLDSIRVIPVFTNDIKRCQDITGVRADTTVTTSGRRVYCQVISA